MPGPETPAVGTSGRAAITLAQFLKAVRVADSGGQAKALVRAGRALVNGERETRPGRRLAPGDVVASDGRTFIVDR